jgi:hypothetical protein
MFTPAALFRKNIEDSRDIKLILAQSVSAFKTVQRLTRVKEGMRR